MVVTKDYNDTFPDGRCAKNIKEAFNYMNDAKSEFDTYAEMKEIFNLCDDIQSSKNVTNLYEHLMNGLTYMAMTDYPFESSFLTPMPANPVNVSCEAFKDIEPITGTQMDPVKDALTDRQKLVLGGLKAATDVYFNYTGMEKCTDFTDVAATGNLGDAGGWDALACNQIAMPMANSKDSMFLEDTWDYAEYSKDCMDKFGMSPDYDWVLREFGGAYNYTKEFSKITNIIYSNGDRDPWKAGGVTEWVNIDTPVYIIKGGAHHLDLRLPTEADKGQDVEWVRD